jgi:hypothetical protein
MFNNKMRLIGVSILVCLAAFMAIPAFAAAPAQGSSPGHVITTADEAKILGFAENRTASLEQKGVDVTNLNAALASAKIAIQNGDLQAFKDVMKTFNQDILTGIKDGSIPKPTLQETGQEGFQKNCQKNGAAPQVLNATLETKMLDKAKNLTTTLQQKGLDVTNLNAALSDAQTAIQNADVTAFKDAMKTFNEDIRAGIKNGSIDKSVLPQQWQRPASAMGTHPFASGKNHVNNTGSATTA